MDKNYKNSILVDKSTENPISQPFEVETKKQFGIWNFEQRNNSNFIEYLGLQDELHLWKNLNCVTHIIGTYH